MPSERQARVLWASLTALAVGVLLALAGLIAWGLAWMVNQLSSVLLPIAVAGVIAFLLDPIVDQFTRRGVPRVRAILLVFFLAVMTVAIMSATVVPMLVVEIQSLVNSLPDYAQQARVGLSKWLASSPLGMKARVAWDEKIGAEMQSWMGQAFPVISTWVMAQLSRVASWAGLVAGFALVPVYAFYFLLEKSGIERQWTDYLPIQESRLKEELVFILTAINECLIVFFRGQVLVAMCVGTLLMIGFSIMGLHYAVLLGAVAGLLGIIPYLGVMISLVPALTLAAIQFGWTGPLFVLLVVVLVQMAEGLFISPKIIGERVGLHPLTIIIAVMTGTTLLGGVLGGVLAIPLTAALRTLMFRYVWKNSMQSRRKGGPAR
jgi:predicted PurR-regulated permease PerM